MLVLKCGEKIQRTGALQDASRYLKIIANAPASRTAVAIYRLSVRLHPPAFRRGKPYPSVVKLPADAADQK
jgi:hypothetical protein